MRPDQTNKLWPPRSTYKIAIDSFYFSLSDSKLSVEYDTDTGQLREPTDGYL